MKHIDLSRYPRREHFEHFLTMENPFVCMTVRMDITAWLSWQRRTGRPFFLCFQYAAVQAANRIPALRQRILDGGIVEYDFCHPSYTVALPDGTYRYCMVRADQPLAPYLEEGRIKQAEALQAEGLQEEGDALSQLFITCVPWLSFEALQMPFSGRGFSNPSIAWGQYEKDTRLVLLNGEITQQETVTIPVVLMVNHALADGKHIAEFFANLEQELEKMTLL